MAELPVPEATGSNRRVKVVVGLVVLIVIVLIAKSIQKRQVISGLANGDSAVRAKSTQWLMDKKILTDTLSRQTVPVKRPMIRTLREMNTEATAGEIIALMKDRNPTVQNEAQFALRAMQPTSIAGLVGALKNADLNVKNRAAAALISIGQPVLKSVTKETKDAKTGETTTTESVPLLDAISDGASRPGVIRVVSAVNSGATPWLLKKLADEKADAATKACAVEILGRIHAVEAAPVLRALLVPKPVEPAKADAKPAEAPVADAKPAEPAKAAEPTPVDPAIRTAVLVALSRLRHPEAFALLQEAIGEDAPTVKNTAIVGLGELQDTRAVALLQVYLFGYDEALRNAAVASLTKIGPPAVPALTQLLKASRYEVRQGALRALQGIDDSRVPALLASALKDADEVVRRTAAATLARPGDARAVAPLLGALADPAWRVAFQASNSLSVVGAPAIQGLASLLGKDQTGSMGPGEVGSFYAQAALERIGRTAVPSLIRVAQGGSVVARQRAVLALGNIGDPAALAVLEKLAANQDPSAKALAAVAVRALKQIREGRRLG